MLRAYANNALLGGDWLLGQEGEQATSEGEPSGDGGFSLSDVGSYASKAGELIKTGQSALNTVTGGGTKTAGAKPSSSDPYWRCAPMKDARSKAQCKYEVDRALALRARATAKKPTSTGTYLLIAAGLAAVGGAAWWVLR